MQNPHQEIGNWNYVVALLDNSILFDKKQRHHFANKGQSYGFFFPVAMYRCESWTIKKAEHQRIDAFELLCWRRHLRVPWTAKEIKPVNPKGNQP